MTSPTALPPCPDCRAPLTGGPSCTACGLRLTGPDALRLWEVDQALTGLDAHRTTLLAERNNLLAALRPGTLLGPAPVTLPPRPALAASSPVAAGAAGAAAPPVGADWMPPVPGPVRAEWTPQRVQNTLLALGALLLTVAGIVFAAVTYDRLGAGGRAVVLVALTALAGLAVPRLKARGLDATAEAVTVVTLALAVLDAYGLRTLGLAASSAPSVYAAGTSLALAVTAGLYAAVVPVRGPRLAAVALAHLPVPLLLWHTRATLGEVGLALALLAAADLAAWVVLQRTVLRDVQATVTGAGLLTAGFAIAFGTAGAFFNGEGAGQLGLLALAALLASAGLLTRPGLARIALTALPAPLVATAAFASSSDRLAPAQQPLVLAAVGLVAMQVAGLLARPWRHGPVAGALVVTASALSTQAEAIVQAMALPLGWLGRAWTLTGPRDARHALSPELVWSGTVVALVVLVCAAVTVAGAGLALHQLRLAAAPTAVLLVAAAVVLPLGLATSYSLALVLLLASAAALLSCGAAARRTDVSLGGLGAGTAVALLAGAWSVADRDANLATLTVLTGLFAAVALRRAEAAGIAGLTGGALLAAGGAARGLSADQVGGLLLIAPAMLVALTFVLDRVRRVAVEVAAAVLAATAIALASQDAGWLSWTLATAGLVALADALHADRRLVAAAGGLLLSASSWVRLADAGVHAPEPYVVPLGLVALALGWLRVRRAPSTRSFPAYSPGLSLLLLPSLLASFDDQTLTRPLLLGAAALLVLLVGARERLQAPLVIGGAVLAVDALQLLAPYAAALPRWLTLGAAGLLLVAVGATYEQRRRDVARMREHFEALT
ncbi:MAG: putative integral rane protein [Frankiales bacterium]|nr:putative integral rane protein [Frankiales bacterium]